MSLIEHLVTPPEDRGLRFVKRGERWLWVWPELMQPEDIDCTDMTDDELAQLSTPKSVDTAK